MATKNKKPFGDDLSFASKEAYNLLRTNIQFTLPQKDRGSIIGVTSAGPGEGKSYTSVNLACALANFEKKVVLVDGDMRKPTTYRYLEVENKPGLSDALVGKKTSVIKKTKASKYLDCIPAGTIPPNPSELIGSNQMKTYLLQLASEYDYVFVDLPPVGVVSDALAVSPYLDGIAIVVRHGITRPRALNEAISHLELAKANILGFVYNAFFHSRGISIGSETYSRYKNYYSKKEYKKTSKDKE